jgi:uncharacterized protein YheU (UPF0270 family)
MAADDDAVFIPIDSLSVEALRGVIESYVLREGTDYGEREISLPDKVEHVMRQLRRAEAQIVFNAQQETIDIVVTAPQGRKGRPPHIA